MESLNNLRANLRRLRLQQGLTQQDVADRASLGHKYVQNIEAGRWPNLTLATLEKFARALRVKPWELICAIPQRVSKQPDRKRGVRRAPSKSRK